MDVKIEDVSGLTKKVTITLPSDLVQGKLDEEYTKIQKETKMRGFRRGKVPRSVVVKSYKPQVEAEVGEKLVQETYFDVIEKEDVDPVVHPEIKDPSFNEDGTFTYVAQIDVRPEFELGEYKGLEIEKPNVEVEEAAVDFELAAMQRDMAALKSVEDREIKNDDVVIVDYQGFHNGHAMKQVKNDDYTVDVGSGKMGEEFESKLVGMKKGEEATHEVDFPEKHPNPILAGKKVEFKITVKDVKERILADLDDEFAKDVNEQFKTIDELKNQIRDRIKAEKENAADGEITDRIMQKLLANHQFEVPERLVSYEVQEMIKQTEQQLEQAGMSLEAAGMNREELAKTNRAVAVQRVTGDFILKKVAEVEEIKVADEDLDRAFKRIGDQYNMPVAKVKEFFQNREDLLPLMNEVLNEKVLLLIKENAKMIEAEEKAEKPAKKTTKKAATKSTTKKTTKKAAEKKDEKEKAEPEADTTEVKNDEPESEG
ncbi:MAG: trigger factor [Desulfobulbaceae bacterium]|nr:MAG: trigger factor [Desulfobulbaceae bacterium]